MIDIRHLLTAAFAFFAVSAVAQPPALQQQVAELRKSVDNLQQELARLRAVIDAPPSGALKLTVPAERSDRVGTDYSLVVGRNHRQQASGVWTGSAREVVIDAGTSLVLKSGSSSITLKSNGDVQINGKAIGIAGSGSIRVRSSDDVIIQGRRVLQN
jgi:hypothetical protein